MGTIFSETLAPEARDVTDAGSGPRVQSCGFLLELSPDWLILRASENAHSFLGEYQQRLVGEPLASFTLAQALHDLRNSLSRQRSCSGIARAYRVRLIDDRRYYDVAFQALDGRILLEGMDSTSESFGIWLGSVSRLLEGLRNGDRKAMLEGAARRARALTGFDRVLLCIGNDRTESSRSALPELSVSGTLPALVADTSQKSVKIFPPGDDRDIEEAVLRSPTPGQLEELSSAGVQSALRVPVLREGEEIGHFLCANATARPPSFEQHAALELFAQTFAMLLPDRG